MKKFATLLLFLTLSLLSFAGLFDGKISVTHLGVQDIQVEIDGKNYGNDRLVIVDNLKSGSHTIVVYSFEKRGNSPLGSRRLIYNGKIKLKANYHVDIVINRFGKTFIDERLMDDKYQKSYGRDEDYALDRRDNDRDRWDDRNGRNDRDRYGNNRLPDPIKAQTFTSLVETLRRESFEATRLKLAKQTAENYSFTTAQVKQLLQLFSYEESKLDLAKHMYALTIDKAEYFLVYDVFSFSSSKEQLSAYVKNYK
jgi:hypothetical protein